MRCSCIIRVHPLCARNSWALCFDQSVMPFGGDTSCNPQVAQLEGAAKLREKEGNRSDAALESARALTGELQDRVSKSEEAARKAGEEAAAARGRAVLAESAAKVGVAPCVTPGAACRGPCQAQRSLLCSCPRFSPQSSSTTLHCFVIRGMTQLPHGSDPL